MRILWLKTELLHPVDKGGKIRTYQMLKELKKLHHITYLTLDDGSGAADAMEKAEEYAHETITVPHRTTEKRSGKFYADLARNLASRLPYALEKYVSAAMRSAITQQLAQKTYDILVCDFLAPAVNVPEDVDVPTLLFQHNVEAMIWRRHYEVARNPVKKAYMREQWRRMEDYERAACKRFRKVVAVSEQDAETMRAQYGVTDAAPIPTGVDTDFFSPAGDLPKDGSNLVFTGSMDWLPNEDAIGWFAEEIFPMIRERVPGVSLTVVGRNPSPSLIGLSRRDPSVIVTGRVPDVRPFMRESAVYVVPIRIGGGTRLKIYEAMAMNLPVVSTAVGAEGLPVTDGENILLRDRPLDFCEAVINLLGDKSYASRIGARAGEMVRRNFSWGKVADSFASICEETIAGRSGSSKAERVGAGGL